MVKNILTVNPFQKLNKLELEFLKWFKFKKKNDKFTCLRNTFFNNIL